MKVLPVGTRLQCGSVLLEVTQIGKDCHSHCTIYYQMGKCIMPSNGIFARVLQEGEISVRDTIQVLPETGKEPFRAAVITLSDKGAAGELVLGIIPNTKFVYSLNHRLSRWFVLAL